jgi:hypothetical protein
MLLTFASVFKVSNLTMNEMQRFHFMLLFASIWVISCSDDKLDPNTDVCTEEISYTQEIRSIINTSCAYIGCHDGSSAPGNYTSFQAMQPVLTDSDFMRRVIESQDMPPSYSMGPTSLSQEDLILMRCWILGGFQE